MASYGVEMCNMISQSAAYVLQRLHEMQQLDRRKLRKPLVYILLLPFEEDPSGRLVQLSAHKVNSAAHRPQRRVGLALEVDVPPLLAAFQLSHVLAVLGACHGPLHYRLSCDPPARVPFPTQRPAIPVAP